MEGGGAHSEQQKEQVVSAVVTTTRVGRITVHEGNIYDLDEFW